MNKIEITNNAQDHIASILEKDSATYFRITVLGGGCAGFQYKFDFENLKNEAKLGNNLCKSIFNNIDLQALFFGKVVNSSFYLWYIASFSIVITK